MLHRMRKNECANQCERDDEEERPRNLEIVTDVPDLGADNVIHGILNAGLGLPFPIQLFPVCRV